MRRLLVLATLAGLLVSGCGSDPKSTSLTTDYGAAVRSSVEKTKGQASKLAISITTDTAQGAFSMTGTGAFKGNEGSMTLTAGPMTIQEVVTGGTIYMQISGQPGWYGIDLEDVVGTSFQDAASPTDSGNVLLAAGNDVSKVGTETVRGDRTTHYKGTISLEGEQFAKLGGLVKKSLQKLIDSGVRTVPFDAWIDEQGRLRKLVQVLKVTAEGQTADVSSTFEIYDFGTKVSVTAPPADQVKDGSQLLKGLGG